MQYLKHTVWFLGPFVLLGGAVAIAFPAASVWVWLVIGVLSALIGSIGVTRLSAPPPSGLIFDPNSRIPQKGQSKPQSEVVAKAAYDDLNERLAELKMLRQFSEAMNFTAHFDGMLWLVYTHCQDVLNARDFNIYLTDKESGSLYTAFCMQEGDRCLDHEGLQAVVADNRIAQIIDVGQVVEYQDEDGRYWITAPLNAGADTVGALQGSHLQLDTPFSPEVYDIFTRLAYNTAAAFEHWMTNQTLERRARQLETLIDVIQSINMVQKVEPLLELILTNARDLLKVEAGSFLLSDQDTGDLEFKVVHGPSAESLLGKRLPYGQGIAGHVARAAEPVVVNDVDKVNEWFSGIDAQTDYRTYSILTVPLVHLGEVLGVVQVVNKQNGAPFTDDDLLLMTAFADEAAVALQNARLLEQTDDALQLRVRELTLLREIDTDLNQDLNIERALERTLDWMAFLFTATSGYMVVSDVDGQPIATDSFGYDSDPYTAIESVNDYPGSYGQVMREQQPVVMTDLSLLESHEIEGCAPSTRSQMIVPIIQDNHTIGGISIESDISGVYDGSTLETAVNIINHIQAGITNDLLYRQVEEANRAKSEFVSIASHELKTPLASIQGFAGLMKSGLTGEMTEQQIEFLRTIDRNVVRMSRIIQDLTDVSRIDTGQLRVSPEPIPFNQVINETVNSIQSLTQQKEIQIHLDLLPYTPIVLGDHSRLVQVLTNLMSNACKYSPNQSDVFVSLNNGDGKIHCKVKDTGYGISEDDQAKLFTKFFRSSDADIRKETGTGLGLSISKALVELHGGEMGFASQLGEGTEFWFTVPLAQP